MAQEVNTVYRKLQEIRKSKDLKLNPNPYLNPKYAPRYYQIQGVLHMYIVRRFILGDDCGLGKSYITIITYASLLIKNPKLKLLIVCPSSAMYQWANEFKKFCIGITTQIVESKDIKYINGVKLKSKDYLKSFDSREYQFNQFLDNDKNVLIFNYHTLQSDFHLISEILQKDEFMVVYDEATAFKNIESNTSQYAKEVSKIAERVYGLSATIIKNDLLEAYSIYKVIIPNLFGSIEHFKKNYCIIERKQLWKGKGKKGHKIAKIIGYKNLNYFNKSIDPFYLGRKKHEIKEQLPEITVKEVFFHLNSKQKELYEDALKGFLDFSKFNYQDIYNLIKDEGLNNNVKNIEKLTALIYCQQICNSPKTIGFDAPSEKEKEILRLLTDELKGEKVVIYTRFKRMVNRLEEIIENKVKVPTVKITGDVKNEQREANKQIFNTSKDHNIMLINSAAKEAVNLQSSAYLIFYDLPFSYGDFLQIVGRIHRIGSPHDKICIIYLLGLNTVDEKTHNILTDKKELFDTVLGDSAKGAIKTLTENEVIDALFKDIIVSAKELNQ